MTVTIDRRLLILCAIVMAAHIVAFWTQIQTTMDSFGETAAMQAPAQQQDIKVTIVPMTDKQMAGLKAQQQIVQNDDRGADEKPKNTAFLGEKDKSHQRQTVARKVDVFNKAAKGNSTADAVPRTKIEKAAKTETVKKIAPKDLKFSDIGMQAMASAPQIERKPASLGKKGIENGDEKSQGLSSTNDYIEHVALGDFTQLNTVEYKYYGFFTRIRGKLEQFWGRTLREKADSIYKSGRTIASADQYTTALSITLNAKGEIVGVKVKSSSGVRELDDAAIESFNQAGPFPNPPTGLLVNGHATIEWGFVVNS